MSRGWGRPRRKWNFWVWEGWWLWVDKRLEKAERESGVSMCSPPSLHCQPGPSASLPLPSGPYTCPSFPSEGLFSLHLYDSTKHFQARKELPANLGKGDSQLSPMPESWTVPRDELSQCSQLENRPTAAKWLDINSTFEQSSKLPNTVMHLGEFYPRTKPYLPQSWFCLEGKMR